jgi:putative ubiquitin-RnfH superfamily antitoxin RatB of RatAB toxin-antitoxin module
MDSADTIAVKVVYALPDRQRLIALQVPQGTTVQEAIERSGLMHEFPEIDVGRQKIGVFGKRVSPQRVLSAGERVEIYRPLIADPKEARRQRASKRK